jgi:hypothetical protein
MSFLLSSVVQEFAYSATSSGGLAFGGAAALSKAKAYAGSGGLVFAGAAQLAKVKAFTPAGGVVFGGGAAFAKIKSYAPSGGIVFGGAAVLAKGKAWAGAGGIVFAGDAITSYQAAGAGVVYSYAGSGGIELGGQAVSSYVAAPVEVEPARGGSARYRVEWARTEAWPPVELHLFEYAGAGGLALGGAAVTSFDPVPAKVYEALVGRLNARQLGGAAATEYVDGLADARQADAHDLALFAELAR